MTSTNEPDEPARYQTFVRSEARLRPDQADALTVLRRRVAAARTDKSERITDNTLLRIAVDLLLKHGALLRGNTEAEMRKSLGIQDPGK
jgi:hypothetical protein